MHEKPRKPTPWLTFACIALVTAFVGVKMLQDWYPIEALYAGLAVASGAMVLLVWIALPPNGREQYDRPTPKPPYPVRAARSALVDSTGSHNTWLVRGPDGAADGNQQVETSVDHEDAKSGRVRTRRTRLANLLAARAAGFVNSRAISRCPVLKVRQRPAAASRETARQSESARLAYDRAAA